MKKLFAVLTITLFLAPSLGAAGAKDAAKTAACKATCMKSKEKCDQKAAGSKFKQIACQKSYESCLKDCEKEDEKK